MIRRGGAKEGKGELRDERDKRGSGVRVSSFDPLSLLRLCESRVLPTCPCFDSNESLPPCSPTVRSARARALAHPPVVSPSLFPPTRRRRRRRPHRLAGDDRDREAASLM